MAAAPLLTIGTRGSPLALAQVRLTAAALANAGRHPVEAIAIKVITTTGDATQDRALSEIGGKGLFTKEIDQAQLDGEVDLAVHSAKDLPTILPDGLDIAGYLEREDVRDALIAPRHLTLEGLPMGARVGTVSLRRQALLRQLRPDLKVETLRGNVGTRLAKVRAGDFDATILAMAGLNRLGLADAATAVLDHHTFIPAVGQGAIALVIRADDKRMIAAIAAIAHGPTAISLAAERAFLHALDGSCRTPIGAYAHCVGDILHFRGIVLTPDGAHAQRVAGEAAASDAAALGLEMADWIRTGPDWAKLRV